MKRPKPGGPKRRSKPRPQKKIYWIFSEGEVTEPSYLAEVQRRCDGVVFDIKEKGFGPTTLVKKARSAKKARPKRNPDFDEVWCVFDRDEHPNIESAMQEARDSEISVALSNPCFELWLVLHREDQTAHIGRHEIAKRANELGVAQEKSPNWDALEDGVAAAIVRAEKLRERHLGNDSQSWANPSSGMADLIKPIWDE